MSAVAEIAGKVRKALSPAGASDELSAALAERASLRRELVRLKSSQADAERRIAELKALSVTATDSHDALAGLFASQEGGESIPADTITAAEQKAERDAAADRAAAPRVAGLAAAVANFAKQSADLLAELLGVEATIKAQLADRIHAKLLEEAAKLDAASEQYAQAVARFRGAAAAAKDFAEKNGMPMPLISDGGAGVVVVASKASIYTPFEAMPTDYSGKIACANAELPAKNIDIASAIAKCEAEFSTQLDDLLK